MDNNIDLFQAIYEAKRNVEIWEEEIKKAKNFNETIENNIILWQEFEKSIETAKRNSEIIENTINQRINFNWDKLFEFFENLPEKSKEAAKKWASYGWIPNLPKYTVIDLMKNLNAPKSKSEADHIMNNRIENNLFKVIVNEISDNIKSYGQNEQTFFEAVSCFENGFFISCSLLLFALIDSCFLINQPRIKRRRDLANKAVSRAMDESKANYSIIALTAKTIIEQLFLDGNDFDYSREQGLNRNFISHGMNKYNPDRTDCLKLFVLIYNIYFLFDVNFFTWSNPLIQMESCFVDYHFVKDTNNTFIMI